MAFGFIFSRGKRSTRKVREASVRNAVQALNCLDYDRFAQLLHPDAIILNPQGTTTKGRQAFIEQDEPFRSSAARPEIVIRDIVHHDNEVLASGFLMSEDPGIGGPTMWRVEFDGDLISRVETTRAQDNRMALRSQAAAIAR